MGILTDVIVADGNEAEEVFAAEGDHWKRWPCLQSKGVDNIMLGALWSVLDSGESGEALSGDTLLVKWHEQGPWLFSLPGDLTRRLSAD